MWSAGEKLSLLFTALALETLMAIGTADIQASARGNGDKKKEKIHFPVAIGSVAALDATRATSCGAHMLANKNPSIGASRQNGYHSTWHFTSSVYWKGENKSTKTNKQPRAHERGLFQTVFEAAVLFFLSSH